MQKIIQIISALLLFLSSNAPAEQAANWTFKTPADESIEYHQHAKGRVSVLLFWATWCPYCHRLMPHLQTVSDEFDEEQVVFYALNIWERSDPARYVKENNFTFTLLLEADAIVDLYDVEIIPTLLVVDRQYNVIYRRKGSEKNVDVENAVRETIKTLIKN